MTTATDFVFAIYSTSGAPQPGLTATWLTYKEIISGATASPPTVTDCGGGLYSVPWITVQGARYVGVIDFGPTANPRYVEYDSPSTAATNSGTPATVTATSKSLLQLRTLARQYADMPTDGFVSDQEINSYINASIAELYDLLVQKYGDDYYVKDPPYTFITDGVNNMFALPTDMYKLLGVDLQVAGSANGWITLRPFNRASRNRFLYPNVQATYGLMSNMRYRIHGANLWFSPIPAGGQTIRLWYVPRVLTLVADTNTFDGISGWEEYAVVDVAIKCLRKEESDVSVFMLQKQALTLRIEQAAENRDAGSPATVSDSSSGDGQGMDWGWGDPS